ncbi:MAG: hemerythrin domain-containing protein [Phycisphaerales bacterium]|jgi:hemerythrin-like domain-containing protein|nr:hemerythrin domain-containing protein [Phycisphaerales bacterium]
MPVKLGAKAEHDFEQPLGLLGDCHRRIENFLGVLIRVADIGSDQPLTTQQREALIVALRYFGSAAPRHTADEEESLFPRMRQLDDPRVQEAMAKLDALEADHQKADVAHKEVDVIGRKWLDQGTISTPELVRMKELLQMLLELYQRHIQVEDQEIFPLASEVLANDQVSQIGQEMAKRRGH